MKTLWQNIKGSALFQSGMVAGLCLAVYWIGPLGTWETNDDVYYNLLFSGKLLTSAPEPHAVMVNFVLSSVFTQLYTMASTVPWYGYFHVTAIILSIWYLNYCYALTRDNDKLLLRIVLSLATALPLLFLLQFTKTAAVLAVSGYLGLYLLNQFSQFSPRKKLFLYAGGASLLVLSYVLRKESFLLMSLLCGLLIASALVQRKRALLITLTATLGLILTATLVHKINYGEEWQNFYALSRTIGPIIDYNQFNYEENKKVIAASGLSKNDYDFIQSYGYADSRVYSPERLDHVFYNSTSVAPPRDLLRSLQGAVAAPAKNYILTIFGLVVLLFLVCRLPCKLWILYIFLPLFICTGILAWQGRFPTRVCTAMLFFVPWAMLVLSGGMRKRLMVGVAWVVMLIALAIPIYGQYQDLLSLAQLRQVENQDLHNLGESISSSPITLVTFGGSFPYEGLLPFESPSYLMGAKIIWLCGMTQTPVQKKQLADNKIDDLFSSLSTNTGIYAVLDINTAVILKKYINEHYKKNINYLPVYVGNSFTLFRLMPSSPSMPGA